MKARGLAAAVAIAGSLILATSSPAANGDVVRCIEAAAEAHHLPLAVDLILLRVEGGSVGAVTRNTNDTVDIGPMQVNTIWVPVVARHWQASDADTYAALRDNFCANVEAGSWILRQAIDEAHGNLWEGVGLYHSHDPAFKADYLRKVLAATLGLQKEAARSAESVADNLKPRS